MSKMHKSTEGVGIEELLQPRTDASVEEPVQHPDEQKRSLPVGLVSDDEPFDEALHFRMSNGDVILREMHPEYIESLQDQAADEEESRISAKHVAIGGALGLLATGVAIGGYRAYIHLRKEKD